MKMTLLLALCCAALLLPALAQSTPDDDRVPADFIQNASPHTARLGATGSTGVLGRQSQGGVLGIDTIPNWSSYFYLPGAVPTSGGDFARFSWQYTMVGNAPFGKGDDGFGRTNIGAPIVPVITDLRNFDGTPRYCTDSGGNNHRMILDPTPQVATLLGSPIFSNYFYDSSHVPTQFTDAVQRAEFNHQAPEGWHTLLRPRVATTRTLVLIRGTYRFAVDSNCNLLYVLVDANVFGNDLFPPTPDDTTTLLGAAEHAGEVRTRDISTFFFSNTFLYENGNPADCCVLGYHSYDVEPGDIFNGFREKHYVMNYSSWISPGLFGDAFVDVTAVSHELAETFNDPFVNNATPIWVAPNGICQNNLETGDVIEGLANATFPITLNGYTYHPQNEALLQWFAAQSPSSATDHAYSYPDTTVLTGPSVSYFSDCATPFTLAKKTVK